MRILAIQPGHNATVCLLEDGKITAVLSQEKIDNRKNSAAFPSGALHAILEHQGLNPTQIDQVAIAGNEVFPERCYDYLFDRNNQIRSDNIAIDVAKKIEKSVLGRMFPGIFSVVRAQRYKLLRQQGAEELAKKLADAGLGHLPRVHIEHHTCHARAAYHGLDRTGGTSPALIFTLDGSGDGLCATVTLAGPGNGWQRLAQTPVKASLGGIYSNTTRFLGMKILEHEYKVMGLAPYCKEHYRDLYHRVFESLVDLDPQNPLRFCSTISAPATFEYLTKHAVGERFDNIAGAVQYLLEERVTAWIGAAIARTGIRRIFTGGGVFMNVKLNKRIQEMSEVEEANFLPSCGDESNSIGAAYAEAVRLGLQVRPLEHLYLGIDFNEEALRCFIEDNNLAGRYKVSRETDIEEATAGLLAKGQIVARFTGRCEWGARSLGNRAILAHPSLLESFYTVNNLIKARDFWMPFAPTIMDSAADKYLTAYKPSQVEAPYMITAYQATSLGIKHLRAAMHQGDHTLRPQVLKEATNPTYYHLIKLFEAKTGVGGVLNTSFNLHGYPLVASPEQALMTFEQSGLRYLALGPFLISKTEGLNNA